jgi:hypothetical protein
MRPAGVAALFSLTLCTATAAETVAVTGRSRVDISKWFACTQTPRSSVIRRVCYDKPKRYMLVELNTTWDHHCEIGERVVTQLLSADSAGTYYNRFVRGGPYNCRLHRPPLY